MKVNLLAFGLIVSTIGFSQNSFVNTIDYTYSVPLFGLEIGSEDKLSIIDMLGFSGPDEHFKILNLSSDGEFESGYSINIDSIPMMFGYKYFQGTEDNILVSFYPITSNPNLTAGLFSFNIENNSFWTRKIAKNNFNVLLPASISMANEVVVSAMVFSDNIFDPKGGIGAFDLFTGKPIWAFRYFPSFNIGGNLTPIRITDHPDGKISLIFLTSDELGNRRYGLAALSGSGEMISNKVLIDNTDDKRFLVEQNYGLDNNGNAYVVGISGSTIRGDSILKPFIAKFESNLDLVWAKRLFAENFPYEGLKHRVFPNGEVIFVYNTNGDLPVIVGKLDPDGNLLWHRGYSFFNPEIQIGSDGSIYFLSPQRYLPDGTSEPATLLAKADPNGDIDSCPQFDACLTLFDMDIPYERWDWIREPADTFGTYNATITPFTTTTEDYCGTPAKPTAFFTVPDTICQSTILEPDSLNNALAHGVEWTITGQNTDLEIEDDSWQYQFSEPGTYQIEQEVWLLGCSEFYTKTLTVLNDSLGDLLGDNRLICEGDSIMLAPKAARPLRTFDWSDGSTDSSVIVSESGVYEVEVSDGFCKESAVVNLTFIEDRYPEPIIDLPTDSTLCIDLLPLVLAPMSIYTDSFYFENSNDPQSVFELNAAGNYSIETEIENCRIKQNFELKVSPCEIDIFIPNSFSPNDDGINDFAVPLGKDFTGLSLEIYNRWGGKVFYTKNEPFAWDGKFEDKKANEGVYVLVFKYKNHRTGNEELITGDVLLVR